MARRGADSWSDRRRGTVPEADGRAVDFGAGGVIVATPPSSERLWRAALDNVDIVAIVMRAGSLEVSRVQAILGTIPAGVRHGLMVIAARMQTRYYGETVTAREEAGIPVWGNIPERVALTTGDDSPLMPETLDAYRRVPAEVTSIAEVDC